MYKLEVTLKQHTPLIHFQHDQEGATLRASEVKPKLDRFILTRLGEGKMTFEDIAENEKYQQRIKKLKESNPNKTNHEIGAMYAKEQKWLVGKGDKPALDYKMRITPKGEVFTLTINSKIKYEKRHERKNKLFIEDKVAGKSIKYLARERQSDKKRIYDLDSYPLFFGNMDADFNDNNEYKKFSFTDDIVNLRISTNIKELLAVFMEAGHICDFFFNNNFGTRQSKGFGSFYIDKNDKFYASPNSAYKFDIDVDGEYFDDDFKLLFSNVELFYKTLRGGINLKNYNRETEFYFKSLLFMYCKDILNAKWDKRSVKEKFYPNRTANTFDNLEKQRNDYSGQNNDEPLTVEFDKSYDVRDLLGFSTNEQWLSFKDSIEKKIAIKENDRFRYPRENETLSVERMRSSLLFKPIYNDDKSFTIFINLQDDAIGLDKFKSVEKICIYSKRRYGDSRFMINIPSAYTTEDYFNYILNKIEIVNHVDEEFHNHEYFEILDDIYTQLKENINQ